MITPPANTTDAQGNGPAQPDDFEVAHTAITRAIRAINNEQRPGDGAEFITHVLATVAANLGSSYAVIQGRPGSWEASGVGQLLSSTVGCDDEFLMTYRTEPVEIVASSTYELDELGIYETYEASLAHIRQTLFGDRWTPARDQLTDAELEQIDDVEIALIDLEDSDAAEYEQRFAAMVAARWEQLRTENPLGYPTELGVTVQFVTSSDTRARTDGWGTDLASRLYQHARENTLLPGSDTLPDWSPGFVDTVLVDGHWPHLRIPELAHYGVPTETPKEN
ncbi:hypothetical protein OHA70_25495 [Kribbella sp. NBC_00382]|uniref:hypothetical protein n=1 Tax=Kribbella sp. NBC_00382 TaxID=2975967 RepID=UPI002E1FD1A0